MALEVLRPFAWSTDGVTPQHASPGDDPAIPLVLIAGLVAEGYLRELVAPPPASKPPAKAAKAAADKPADV